MCGAQKLYLQLAKNGKHKQTLFLTRNPSHIYICSSKPEFSRKQIHKQDGRHISRSIEFVLVK